MEVRTILWPTDLSRNSLKAAKHVNSLAEKYQAKVIVMYVGVDLMTQLMSYGYPSEEHVKNFQDWELDQAKKKLATVCEENLKACPMLDILMVQGDAAEQIIKAIKEKKADMVVLSSHGRTADDLDKASPEFGSVARKVVANSPVPVHLVNPLQQ
ncbi:MAG: universal stress protein [Syntrophobacterales bacterium]|jgi:nucleotide-binding universal stress UspA family protein